MSCVETLYWYSNFNDFNTQSNTVCGLKSGMLIFLLSFFHSRSQVQDVSKLKALVCIRAMGTYGAAAGDLSPDISGGACSGRIDMSECNGQSPQNGYMPPRCPRGNCGLCYRVTNKGGHKGAAMHGIGKSIIVQIIDSCPSTNAANFCKMNLPASERCESRNTNQLDIDKSAYKALTGQEYGYVSC